MPKKETPKPEETKTVAELADEFEKDGITVLRIDTNNPDTAVKSIHDLLHNILGE